MTVLWPLLFFLFSLQCVCLKCRVCSFPLPQPLRIFWGLYCYCLCVSIFLFWHSAAAYKKVYARKISSELYGYLSIWSINSDTNIHNKRNRKTHASQAAVIIASVISCIVKDFLKRKTTPSLVRLITVHCDRPQLCFCWGWFDIIFFKQSLHTYNRRTAWDATHVWIFTKDHCVISIHH